MTRRPRDCVLCGVSTTGKGEDVIPRWFINAKFAPGDQPFSTRAGRNGISSDISTPRDHFEPVLCPCCRACNQSLATRFEDSRRARVLDYFDGRAVGRGDDARHVRFWLLKTWSLMAHPSTQYMNNAFNRGVESRLQAPLEQNLQWLRGTGGPSNTLTAIAFRADGGFTTKTPQVPVPLDATQFCIGVAGLTITLVNSRERIEVPGDRSACKLWPVDDEQAPLPQLRRYPEPPFQFEWKVPI